MRMLSGQAARPWAVSLKRCVNSSPRVNYRTYFNQISDKDFGEDNRSSSGKGGQEAARATQGGNSMKRLASRCTAQPWPLGRTVARAGLAGYLVDIWP